MIDPESSDYEKMVDFMRADLENNMAYSKIIKAARDIIEKKGGNFDEEFNEWKKRKAKA